jgi:hypothetical protein
MIEKIIYNNDVPKDDPNKTIRELMVNANEGDQQSFEKLFELLQDIQYNPKGVALTIAQPDQPES